MSIIYTIGKGAGDGGGSDRDNVTLAAASGDELTAMVDQSVERMSVLSRRVQAEIRASLLPALREVKRRIEDGKPVDGHTGFEDFLKAHGLNPATVRKWEQRERERTQAPIDDVAEEMIGLVHAVTTRDRIEVLADDFALNPANIQTAIWKDQHEQKHGPIVEIYSDGAPVLSPEAEAQRDAERAKEEQRQEDADSFFKDIGLHPHAVRHYAHRERSKQKQPAVHEPTEPEDDEDDIELTPEQQEREERRARMFHEQAERNRRAAEELLRRAPITVALARVPADVLNVASELITKGRQAVSRTAHPDAGGSDEAMQRVNLAAQFLLGVISKMMPETEANAA